MQFHSLLKITMGKFLLWFQERLKHWTKPAALPLTPGLLLDITRSRTDLIVENAMLRQQLIVCQRQLEMDMATIRNAHWE